MQLYLVHHGDAVPSDLDPSRPLSPHGQASSERLAAEAAARGARPEIIWHSGKLRARQTAEYFWKACNPLATLGAMRGLQPSDPPEIMRDRLAGDSRAIMLVGHMPNLQRLLALLETGNADDPGVSFPQNGMVAVLVTEDGRCSELWRLNGFVRT